MKLISHIYNNNFTVRFFMRPKIFPKCSVLVKYTILICLIYFLDARLLKCQYIPAELLYEFESIFQQKIIRVSQRLSEQWSISNGFIQLFYYNTSKDNRWPQNQVPKIVVTKYTTPNNSHFQILELKDDGIHFDNQFNDGIYANFLSGKFTDFKTNELIIDVCCYYDSLTEDSIGIEYISILPTVKLVPFSPQILSPVHKSVVNSAQPVIEWILDEKADGCGLILLTHQLTLGEKFKEVVYEKNYNQGVNDIFREKISVSLTNNTEYHLIIWSYINTQIINDEWNAASYSLEWSSFLVDTTQQETSSFNLAQNFPNPFSTQTIIRYNLPEAGNVLIKVFDIAGRKITTLVNQRQDGGDHYTLWNGKDNSGNDAASGIYLYYIQFDNQSISGKMILSK